MSRTLIAQRPALYEATLRSLQAELKELPSVWLYDEGGSRLYEEITRLPATHRVAQVIESYLDSAP